MQTETLESLSKHLLKELNKAGLKLNINKHYSLLLAMSQLNNKIQQLEGINHV